EGSGSKQLRKISKHSVVNLLRDGDRISTPATATAALAGDPGSEMVAVILGECAGWSQLRSPTPATATAALAGDPGPSRSLRRQSSKPQLRRRCHLWALPVLAAPRGARDSTS